MGRQLADARFPTSINPSGILYNPESIRKLLLMALKGEMPEIGQSPYSGLWHSFDLHSKWSSPDPERLRQEVQMSLETLRQELFSADVLIVTFGSAMAHRLKEGGQVVANCHKYPGSYFDKGLLSLEALRSSWQPLFQILRAANPRLHLILTVSPVRHLKDTLPLNSVSKSILRLLCHELAQEQGIDYFPAYEVMIDDLRDYRFYADDLLHPTAFAQQYIWEIFQQAYFPESTRALVQRWLHLRQQLAHRPLQPATEAHRRFLDHLLTQLQEINPLLPCQAEIADTEEKIRELGGEKD